MQQGREDGGTMDVRKGRSGFLDVDRLEALLIEAARAQRTLTYAEVLRHFGRRVAPRLVYALCRDLGEVCARNRARGEPELAVLVVRRADGLPGEGFFRSAWRDGAYDGPPRGPAARGFIREQQDRAFAFFAAAPGGADHPPGGSGEAEERQDQGDDDDQSDDVDDGVQHEVLPGATMAPHGESS